MLVSGLVVVSSAAVDLLRTQKSFLTMGINWSGLWWSFWPFAYVGLCIWVLSYVKVIHAGAPMIAIMLFLLGERRILHIAAYSILPVLGIYFLAVHLMRIGVV